MPEYIMRFDSGYRFLSNFWNCDIEFEGKTYPSTEHAFQAAKTLDDKEREEIKNAGSPGAAKRLGKKVTLRPDWESVKYQVMLQVVREKFKSRKDLRERLLDTGDKVLVEGNVWHDKTWGVCYCDNCGGTGKNWLGEILMKVRNESEAEIYADKIEAELNFLSENLYAFAVPSTPVDKTNKDNDIELETL